MSLVRIVGTMNGAFQQSLEVVLRSRQCFFPLARFRSYEENLRSKCDLVSVLLDMLLGSIV